ncbi:DUF1146 family protein [Pseudalkalibacillus berkeleyi]|uniref:DUF1146 family protein n=1 Tax=Pseudalkalibacillus berkeleyi TaxID=1069813 RepID=A0ABS9H1L7_9BACL|nr:DUF1146 family protein [Pseudalkalibacillus berkeleyi]MCF6138883.1 DUF1146 family protein [Pseudalkalibacillus berkeleyi]
MQPFGQQSLLSIIINLVFLAVSWWAIQGLNFEKFIKSGKVVQARLLMILLTIAIASLVSTFFLNYLSWSLQLKYLFYV